MTARSFYTPPGRNTLLLQPTSRLTSSSLASTACAVSLLALILRYYSRSRRQNDISTWALGMRHLLRKALAKMSHPANHKSTHDGDRPCEQHEGVAPAALAPSDSSHKGVSYDDPQRLACYNGCDKDASGTTATTDVTQPSFDQIQTVLSFWFGQYTMDQARHFLWMIPSGSPHQATMDADIFDRFASLLEQLAVDESSLLRVWTRHYGYLGKIAAIVVLDQFSRHILRHASSLASPDHQLPLQQHCDQLAFETAQIFLKDHTQEIRCGMIPHSMYIFAVMPLRHKATIKWVAQVQEHVQHLEQLTEQCDTMVRRFRQATNRRMAVLQDEQRRTPTNSATSGNAIDEISETSNGSGNGQSTVDDKHDEQNQFTEDDILECGHFYADMAPSEKHSVHQAIASFLKLRHVEPHQESPTPVIVSLSGGVDSMVIASVLSYLARHCHYNLRIRAVHIDYANRPESAAEAAYCQFYCQDVLGNIELQVCRIDHVTRGVTARDEYEAVSRQVRFDAYRRAIQLAADETGAAPDSIGIFLGHHRGDLRENVLSNAHKGCGPIELSGMTAVSRNDGVTLFRPLLPLEKKFIFDYAHEFGVPYFKDTTPHWSTRGKLRNKLLPLLEEIYGEGSMNNLSDLAVESDQCRELLRASLFGPFLDQVQHRRMGIVFDTDPWKEQGLFFWKFVLREALHSAAIGMFSDKAVATFLERIQSKTRREGWLQCRKDCGVYLQQDGRIFVLHSASFPWRKVDRYSCDNLQLALGPENALQIGPWRIQASLASTEGNDCLSLRAIRSMDEFMDGRITYYLKAPTWSADDASTGGFVVRPLVFHTFVKTTRPEAWKNTDTKLQDILPLAGVDSETAAALKDPMGCGAWHIDKTTGETTANPVALVKIDLSLLTILS